MQIPNVHLPIVRLPTPRWTGDLPELLTELQSLGMRWLDPEGPGLSRTGGAGPSDHKAVRIGGHTIMVPIFTHASASSPFAARVRATNRVVLERDGAPLVELDVPPTPAFYRLHTQDGTPYWKIATLHAHDVLATTVLQNCIRYAKRATACQFCAIGQSLAARSTIARKTPAQLAEVAEAAVALSGVKHMVLTTGTPPTPDRGAAILAESSAAITAAVDLPVQAQCEPPDDFAWFRRLAEAGVVTLGMHLEAVTELVRRQILPGKSEVSIGTYLDAFEAAVRVFGRGQVTTYILAGLGDPPEAIVDMARTLVEIGVYPFVVPFVPIAGTPLQLHPTPDPAFMRSLLDAVGQVIADGGLHSQRIAAGCGRCGACSTLRARETKSFSEGVVCST